MSKYAKLSTESRDDLGDEAQGTSIPLMKISRSSSETNKSREKLSEEEDDDETLSDVEIDLDDEDVDEEYKSWLEASKLVNKVGYVRVPYGM
jgi:hypothetical protein